MLKRLIGWLKRTTARFAQRFTRRQPDVTERHEAPIKNATPIEPTVQPTMNQTANDAPNGFRPRAPNRRDRRALNAYERARLKKDKFVKPKGPTPTPLIRGQNTDSHPIIVEDNVPTAELNIVDQHHTDHSKVLYKEEEFLGRFYFRDTILDQLDRYFVYLERMRRHDLDAYEFYQQVGMSLVPYMASRPGRMREINLNEAVSAEELHKIKESIYLEPFFNRIRPSFGCFAYGADPHTEQTEIEAKAKHKRHFYSIPKFMYFIKYSYPPPEIQAVSGGDIYKMTVWWDLPHDDNWGNWGHPFEYPIFISKDGKTIRLLRVLETDIMPVRCKRSGKDQQRGRIYNVPQRHWHLPRGWRPPKGMDTETHLLTIFTDAARTLENINATTLIRVAASKNDKVAIFTVGGSRTAYFFQDRDTILNNKGHKKRIFHSVRAHERVTQSGVTPIKLHFRGLREFDWAGYKIKITIPGKDHLLINEIDVGVIDNYWKRKIRGKLLTEGQFGRKLRDWINTGVGAYR